MLFYHLKNRQHPTMHGLSDRFMGKTVNNGLLRSERIKRCGGYPQDVPMEHGGTIVL
jgi:hypothetical protein